MHKHLLSLKCLLAFVAMLFAGTGYAALSGTYTINPGGTASASVYLSLTSAISDLTSGTRADGGPANGAGVSGAVILELAAGYTSSGETFPLTFGAVSGASATNTITVRPASGVSSALTITSNNSTATVYINGGNYFIFDGRNGGTGTNKYLTIDNTVNASAVNFVNDGSNNTIKYCTLSGVNTATGVVNFEVAVTTGNDNNTIDNCDIRDGATTPFYGIYSLGTAGKENSGNTVSNCNIYNFFRNGGSSTGISLGTGSTDWTITNNSFYQTASRTATLNNQYYGIQINNTAGNNFVISGNYIGGSAPACGGSAWSFTASGGARFLGILITAGSTTASSVQGNTIQNFSMTTTAGTNSVPGAWCGIAGLGGNINIGNITGNTIGSGTGTGSVSVTGSTTGALSMGISVSSSTGVFNISNNTIGSITTNGSTTSVSHGFVGIYTNNAATLTINNNTIGSTTTANSINAANASTNTTGQPVCGIFNASTATIAITNNTVANLTNAYAGTGTSTFTGAVKGIVSQASGLSSVPSNSGALNTITGNTIRNLSAAATSAYSEASPTVGGIMVSTSTTLGATTIAQNTIHSLYATAASTAATIVGIYYNNATNTATYTNVIGRNFVHSFACSTSAASSLFGLSINNGLANVQNNMVRLGIDPAGSSQTVGHNIQAIRDASIGSANYYHNSAYVGGTGVAGSINTAAFNTNITTTHNIINNIFVNERSNGAGTGVHYAVSLAGSGVNPTGLTMNYNILRSSGTGGQLGLYSSTNYNTLYGWQNATGQDANSGVGSPNFTNATGNASAVDLHVSGTTIAEGYGTNVAAVTDDYDGGTRSGLTPVDIGADAGSYTAGTDVFAPAIAYTALNGATSSTTNRTFTATITDPSAGVPTSGGNRPKVWFRRSTPSASAWASTSGTFNSGTGNSGGWTFTIDYSQLSITPVAGETYQYYVVAQDLAGTPNIGYSPMVGALHTDVNTQTSAATTPNSYNIVSALPTTINVGSGQTYTSLTGTGGLFEAINAAILVGNTTVNITSDLSEDGTNALNAIGLDVYTLTIQPSAASTRVISNSANLSFAMLRLNGVAGVTIDGRSGGSGQYLRIVNTHTTPGNCPAALEIAGGCTNTTIRNCIIETNSSNSSTGNISFGISGINTGITISNNDIRDAQGTPGTAGIPANGIYSSSTANVVTVQNNNIYNFSVVGTFLNAMGDGCTVSGNSVYYNASTPATTTQTGIYVIAGNNHTVSGNYIGGQAASCGGSAWVNSGNITFSGIQLSVGTVTPSSVQNNTVQNISLTGTTGVNFNGILISSGAVNVGTVTGNLIGHASTANSIQSTGSTVSGTSITIGIGTASSGTTTISNNTVANITSSTSSTTSVGVRGISNTGTGQCTISGNTIHSISSNAATFGAQAAPVGILTNSTNTSQLISQNLIYNLSNTNTNATAPFVLGICTNNSSGAGTISRNRIYGFTAQATNVPIINGIFLSTGSAWTVANNQISLANGSNTNDLVISGIRDGSAGTHNVYYNSVYIGGAASSGAQKSYGYLRTSSATVTVKNNLFYNERSGSSAGQFAIGNISGTPATNWSSTASNNNLFVVGTLSDMGEWGTGTSQTLAQWQSSSSGDAASYVNDVSTLPSSTFYTATATGNLEVQSAFKSQIESRATPIVAVTNDYANTTRDAVTPSIGSIEVPGITWTGATNNTWSTGTNWQGGIAPTTSQTAIIPTGLGNYPIITTGTVAAGSIQIASGGSVTVSGGTLQVARNISNSGTFNATGGTIELNGSAAQSIAAGTLNVSNLILNNSTGATITSGTVNVLDTYTPTSGTLTTGGFLTLKSTASTTARIAAGSTGGGYISGNVTVERYIPGGRRAFRFLAHPFTSALAMSALTDDIDITGTGGSPFTTTGSNNPSAFFYDLATGNGSTTNDVGWTAYTASSTWAQYQGMRALVRGAKGEGLTGAAYTPSAVTLDMTGALNQGDLTVSLTKGSGTSFVVVGNPFAGQIDLNATTSRTNVGSSFFVWDVNQGTRGGYTSANFSANYILPACASFVTTLTANGSITFPEACKSASTPNALLKTTGTPNTVQLRMEDSTIFWDRLLVSFNDNAMAVADYEDAAELYNPEVSFYSFSKDDSMMSIDSRPYAENEVIKLGLYTPYKKSYKIVAADFDVPAGTKLFLRDKYLNATQEITGAGYEYWFTVTSDSTSWGNNRFELNTQGKPTNNISNNTIANKLKVKLVPNPTTDNVTLYYEGAYSKELNITITNAVGVKVAEATQSNTSGSIQIPMAHMAAGMYIVSIKNGNETVTQKLIKQ